MKRFLHGNHGKPQHSCGKDSSMKKHPFIPDAMFDSIFEITPNYLTAAGIRAVVLDIDNTLVTYGMPEPTEEIRQWIDSLRTADIAVSLASNNGKERVERFNATLGVFATYKSGKPSPRAVLATCDHFGITPTNTAVIGDQIFTDILCARRAGALAILVSPLPYNENLFFKCKRMMEKPFIRAYKKQHEPKNNENK